MRFARRTGWDPARNRLTTALERRRREGGPVIDLTVSNPTRCGFPSPDREILDAIASPAALGYDPDPLGLPAARGAISSLYASRGARVPPEHIVLTAGTSEAYSHLFRLLADPGDRILVPSPCYPLLDMLARLGDVELVPYPLRPHLDFAVDRSALGRLAGPRCRAVLAVSPGNPTGTYLKKAECEAIVELCAEREMALVCDEVFADYALAADPDRAGTLAGCGTCLTFVLDGVSKMLALPQLKLGWIAAAGPAPALEAALDRLEMIADSYLSVHGAVQHGLGRLLRLRETIQRPILERIAVNHDRAARRAGSGTACRVLPVEGGWSQVLRVPRTRTDEQWALDLLERGVLVQPGYFYDFPGDGWLVASLLAPEPEFAEGIDRILETTRDC